MTDNLLEQSQLTDRAKQVAHDIRAPLAVLKSQLKNSALRANSTLTEHALQRIDSLITELKTFPEKMRQTSAVFSPALNTDQQNASKNPLHKKSVKLSIQKIIFEKVQWLAMEKSKKIDVDFKVSENCTELCIPGFTDHFERVLSNIFDNSIEAAGIKNPVKLQIRLSAKDGMITLKISDNGPGFHDILLPILGDQPFTYGKADGTGRGLYFAKRFIKGIDGSIEFYNSATGGAVVFMQIPVLN